MIHITKFLPIAQMVLCFGAALVYLNYRDYRHALYWFFAGCLTASVTF